MIKKIGKILYKNFNSKIVPIIISIVIIGGSFILGIFFGINKSNIVKANNLSNKESLVSERIDFSPFWKVWNLLNEKYVDLNKVSDQDKVWGAIEGLTSSLKDPYTIFMPPSKSEIFADDIRGNFSGVGMEVGKQKGVLTVISPLKGTPAKKAGLKSGDKIIKINGVPTSNFSIEKAVRMIRGERGTTVKLTVVRKNESKPLTITVTRDNIDIPTIKTETKGDVFVISLYSFTSTSANLFRGALRKFIKSGKNKLILDLRGNPGGYMEAAVDMASWFLPAGKVVVRENFGKKAPEQVHRSKGYNIFKKNLKFVILVDGGSASAAEILAGALQEHKVATLVGTKTFGKGSVQELISITPKTSLKVTVARWLTPSGKSISKNGLTPDVEVKVTRKDLEEHRDPQMIKAIQLLNE